MLKINNKKLKGFLLLLLGILTAVFAQVILLESRHGDLTTYFTVRLWLLSIANNTSPILGISVYILASIIFMLGLRSFDGPFPLFSIDRFNSPSSKPKFGFWATSIAISVVVAAYASQAGENDSYGYAFTIIWIFLLFYS